MEEPRIVELGEAECWERVAGHRVGRLAVSVANKPDIFPVNYRVDGHDVVVRTAPGFKLAAAVLGSGVAFEVDQLDEEAHTGWSVVIHGTAREVASVEELLDARDLGVDPWAGGQKNHFIRIEPSEITGREIPPAS